MIYDILIKNALYIDGDITIKKGNIAIKDGKILLSPDPEVSSEKIIEDDRLLWMPAFTDGHIHTSQQLLRGRLLDVKPVIWKKVNVPFECMLDEEDSELSAEIAALEMIRSGTGLLIDAGGKFPGIFASVFGKAGLKGRVTRFSNDRAPESLKLAADKVIAEVLSLPAEGNILPIFSVTALTAASRDHFHAVFEAAREYDIPIEVHMNEYASEVCDFIEAYGSRPFEYLDREHLLDGVRMVAPHCIFLSETEKSIIHEYDIHVIHCPFSNCGKGVPDTPSLLAWGIPVGFGSDGAGHGGLDLFKDMRLFRGLMNATHGVATADSTIMSAETLIRIVTAGGASALYSDAAGVISEGAPADIIALDISSPHLFPTQNIIHSIVESADGHDVDTMIIGGRVLMEGRRILSMDEDGIMEKARKMLRDKPKLSYWV